MKFLLAVSSLTLVAFANPIPVVLPDPDDKPGDLTKPVMVYLLAGQSNMVGMGDLAGAKNIYAGVFLTSDPAAPEGPFEIYKIGKYKVVHFPIYGPDGKQSEQALAKGTFEVPLSGTFKVHCDSAITIDGTVPSADVALQPKIRYSFAVTKASDTPPRFWLEKTDLLGNGDLENVVKREKKFPYLIDDSGAWTVRQDVYFQEARIAEGGKGSPLSAASNGKAIGPELAFGHVLGTFHEEQVLLIKTAMGNRALGFDFRPPSSGRTDPGNKWEALEYKLMIEGVQKTLANIGKVVPGYQGQGYELAGFAWWQGHKDSPPEMAAEYEKHLTNLIKDVRKDLKAPKMPAVVATVGFGGHRMDPKYLPILDAQLAVSDPVKHPEFANTVASVDTRDFWREVDESPRNQDYHYNRNAETYLLVGDALGRAMVGLLGGQAEPTPRPKRSAPPQVVDAAEITAAEKSEHQKALRAIMLDGIAASYLTNPRNQKALAAEAQSERPERQNQFLRGSIYGLTNIYRTAGIDDYEWTPFGTDLRTVEWDYLTFDPPEKLAKDHAGPRYRKVTYPAGMENWFAPDFDAAQSGWKQGQQPFGQLDGKLAPLRDCTSPSCGCGTVPMSLWEREVLLARTIVEVPPFKEGHRYRLVVGGSNHVFAGEGYALYINGKKLAESNRGVARREGGQPRGGHIFSDFHEDFKSGKVIIAATSFLTYASPRGPIPATGHFSVWIEEQKVPPILGQ
ncbi:MAG: sialate O-acetylesterase [Akkermansiaceae bacterium]